MKSILLPVDQSEQMPSALESAWHLANLFESTVEGVALRPAFAEIVAPDPIVAVTIPPADWNEVEFTRNVRQRFDTFAAAHATGGARFRWRGGSAVEDSALGSLARVYDVAVLSRPGSRGARMTALEAVLFDSGRPVLMAPPAPPKSPLGQTVLIHWNASTETANDGIRNALPNNAAPATKLTMKANAKSLERSTVKSSRPWPLVATWRPRNAISVAAPASVSPTIRGSSNQSHRLPWLST